jgi:hypothetical protein
MGSSRQQHARSDRRLRLTRFGAGFLIIVIALLAVGMITGTPLLILFAAVLLLIVAGGFFSTAPAAPAVELNENDSGSSLRQWGPLGNRWSPPDDE